MREEERDVATFCQAQYPHLVGMLGLLCRDRMLAEDLAQETLVKVWTHWGRVRTMADPTAWARRVALNMTMSHFRRRAIERRVRARLERSDRSPTPVVDITESDSVHHALMQLPLRQRTAIVLRFYCELSYAEVADAMDAPESTVKSLVRRGIEKLRLYLDGESTSPMEVRNAR